MTARDNLLAAVSFNDAANAGSTPEQLIDAHRAEVLAEGLTEAERQFLAFALNEAFDRMVCGDGFTDEDTAALETLRRLTPTA